MADPRPIRLSKLMALILRHEPERFGVTLDGEGYATMAELLDAVRSRMPDVEEVDIRHVVSTDTVKQRFSIAGSDIRANYGHSIHGKIPHPAAEPPDLLLHGTGQDALAGILATGLKPMSRQYVHLTTDVALALKVGGRHGAPRLVQVEALRAHEAGIPFYRANRLFWLADEVPVEYLSA